MVKKNIIIVKKISLKTQIKKSIYYNQNLSSNKIMQHKSYKNRIMVFL